MYTAEALRDKLWPDGPLGSNADLHRLSPLLDEICTGDDAKITHIAISGSCKTNSRAPCENFPLTGRTYTHSAVIQTAQTVSIS